MGYYGWFRVYVKSTSPFWPDHIVKFVKYIIDNIDQLDPESQTAIYFDVEDGVLEADSFKLSETDDEEEWFPKKLPGQLYKIEIELKYPSENDLKLLLDAAKGCYPESSFIAGIANSLIRDASLSFVNLN